MEITHPSPLEAARYMEELLPALELLVEPSLLSAARDTSLRLRHSCPSENDAAAGARLAGEGPREQALWMRQFAQTGCVIELEEQRLRIPAGLQAMLALPGLGIPEVGRLWREGGLSSLPRLRRACLRRRAPLPGILPELQRRLCGQLAPLHPSQGFWLKDPLLRMAGASARRWRDLVGLERIELAGDARRALELADRLVWVGQSEHPEVPLGRLAARMGAQLSGESSDRVHIAREDGLVEEFVIVDREHFAARLFLETGSRGHVDALLARLASLSRAASLEELGLPATEEALYEAAGAPWIPPELREGRGELEAAIRGGVPRLIRAEDLKGVFHVHTTYSDGIATIEQQARAASDLGWRYLGIADHSQAASYAGGLTPARIAEQAEEIRRLQGAFPALRLFHGVECDILPDGRLDYDDDVLARLDYVIASIHTATEMPREAMTRRIVRALEHPAVTILAHPSGRLLRERPAYALDWSAVFAAAARAGVLIEFNTNPDRLDLDWRLMRAATTHGVLLAVNPDAHRVEALAGVASAVATARKGWLAPEHVFNALPVEAVEEALRAKKRPTD
ncbi:MAG: PHP domain-containing protein [Candidatus Eisenbacteria bacterium]